MIPLARFLLVLVAIMALQEVNAGLMSIFFPVHVLITNKLPGGVMLRVHCKSKDDDLGFRNIAPNQSWGFKFKPNGFTTLFFCSMQWPGHFHYFNVYNDQTFLNGESGQWMITPKGPCRRETWDLGVLRDCYRWRS
ncbi:hypothetical protein BT93_H0742 [Corymbia citriodora subsp. variegata]|nr:hypothetical protein BT93_H0742 [Corymbia citriodora subsp. variegata]